MCAALQDSNPDVVAALLQSGADVNANDKSGNTALDCARETGHSQTAEILEKWIAHIPRPNDAGFIRWLIGVEVATEVKPFGRIRGIIRKGQVSDFQVIRITKNPADNVCCATVSFNATAHGRGVRVGEAMIRYKSSMEDGKLQFVDFTPVSVSYIGN
jgi:hypothetical protein